MPKKEHYNQNRISDNVKRAVLWEIITAMSNGTYKGLEDKTVYKWGRLNGRILAEIGRTIICEDGKPLGDRCYVRRIAREFGLYPPKINSRDEILYSDSQLISWIPTNENIEQVIKFINQELSENEKITIDFNSEKIISERQKNDKHSKCIVS